MVTYEGFGRYPTEEEPGIPMNMLNFDLKYHENSWMYRLIGSKCRACGNVSITRQKALIPKDANIYDYGPFSSPIHDLHFEDDILIWPRGIMRPIPKDTPKVIVQDFKEACESLYTSKRASAALARRCLQHLIRIRLGIRKNLYQEIEALFESTSLPPTLKDALHLIRNLGILGAHPLQDSETDNVLEIEEGEVEMVIDVLGQLLEYYYETLPKLEETARKVEERIRKQKKK
jgi:hypothetical protein